MSIVDVTMIDAGLRGLFPAGLSLSAGHGRRHWLGGIDWSFAGMAQ